jgi:hypothetical protein
VTVKPPHRASPAFSEPPVAPAPRLVLGIATTGRPAVLARTVLDLVTQTRLPDLLVLSVAEAGDLLDGTLDGLPCPVEVLTGPRGLTRQRNRILDRLDPADVLLFLDDDFLMAPDYLAQTGALFAAHPDMVLLTGTVLADGVVGPGLSFEDGAAALKAAPPAGDAGLSPAYSGYGCNMALRAAPVVAHGLRFDENLPLYGWLEDVDFSRVLAPYGRLCRSGALRGVHLGTKAGRTPGRRLGYSQIANPAYLVAKGTLTRRHALELAGRNLLSNLVYSLHPRPWTDSRGRLKGNLIALADLLRGRASPARILDL